MLIAQGRDVVTISYVLGHADPSITLRIYARQFKTFDDAERKRALAAGVGEELAAALNA